MSSSFKDFFKPEPRVDFKRIAACSLSNALPILQHILPGGNVNGNEYVVRNPKRSDRNPGSFKINMKTGRWGDFATNDRGGDLISLLAYIEDITQSDAARRIAKMIGLNPEAL